MTTRSTDFEYAMQNIMIFFFLDRVIPYEGLSPIYTLQLTTKFGFNLELQNQTTLALQLSKKFNFQPSDIFGSVEILYYFFEHLNVLEW